MSVRRTALETLVQITEDGAYANLALKDAASRMDAEQIPALYRLVYTALEHRSYVEYILSHYCKRQKKAVRNTLLLAGSELLYLDTPAHAVVHSYVELCKDIGKKQSAGLVNAVLRRLAAEKDSLPALPDDPVERFTIVSGYPACVVSEWVERFGTENTEKMLHFGNTDLQIRAQFPFSPSDLEHALQVPYRHGKLDPNCFYLDRSIKIESDPLFLSGKITIQNEGAMMICKALGDVRGKRVLDACAAPGGKSAYLASLAENDISLHAWELHPHRLQLMRNTFDRLHVTAVTDSKDASAFDAAYVDAFDAVLLDVPCSGFGLLDDKPDLRYRRTDEDIEALAVVQESILNACSQYVKPGGNLVYATCTISIRENEQQVQRFLNSHASYTLKEQRQLLPFLDGTDGFYYAVMVRNK